MSVLDRDYVMSILNYDSKLQDKVDLAIAWIQSRAESIIGRSLESATYTWYLNGHGTDVIILPVCPVASITNIYLDADRTFSTALAATDYYLDADAGLVNLYNHTTPNAIRSVKVVAVAGYTSTTLPADLKAAFIEGITYYMSRLLTKSFGQTNQSAPDGGNVTFEVEFPTGAKRTIESYKGVRV